MHKILGVVPLNSSKLVCPPDIRREGTSHAIMQVNMAENIEENLLPLIWGGCFQSLTLINSICGHKRSMFCTLSFFFKKKKK